MTKSSIMIDLDDPRSAKIAEVMSNKTSKRILNLLSEREMSESEIAGELKLPMNTIGYNTKKLVEAGLVEKVDKFFWSSKGKKMNYYKISNKRIVISPRRMARGVLPALIGSFLIAVLIFFMSTQNSMIATSEFDIYGSDLRAAKYDESYGTTTPSAVAGSAEVARYEEDYPLRVEREFVSDDGIYAYLYSAPNSWTWFLLGALTALLILILWSWRSK